MELTLSDGSLCRRLARGLQILAKVGEDVMIEATPTAICFRSINAAKTAFVNVSLPSDSFAQYAIKDAEEACNCRVNAKAMMAPFRSLKSVSQLSLTVGSALVVGLDLSDDVDKSFTIALLEGDNMFVSYSRDQCDHTLRAAPRFLGDTLANMHRDEVTLTVSSEYVVVQSYSTEAPADAGQPAIQASISYQASEFRTFELDEDEMQPGTPLELCFAMKEFRAFVEFCDALDSPLGMHFSIGGAPIVFGIDFDDGRLTAEMIVATVVQESMLGPDQMSQYQSQISVADSARYSTPQHVLSHAPSQSQASSRSASQASRSTGSADQRFSSSDQAGFYVASTPLS